MKSCLRLLTTQAIILTIVITLPLTAYAKITTGYDAQSAYNTNGCPMSDRMGAIRYVENLNYWLNFYDISTNSFIWTEWWAWESDMASPAEGGNGLADSVSFFAFSGHTIGPSSTVDARSHFFTDNAARLHSSCGADAAQLAWREVRFGPNKLRWLTMYTCNWLTNLGSSAVLDRIFKTFEGMRLTMGFASTMYIDNREGSLYAYYISQNFYLKDAFFSAAKYYQPQDDPEGKITNARAQGYTAAAGDRHYTSPTRAPKYIDRPGDFSIIQTVQITCNGNKF